MTGKKVVIRIGPTGAVTAEAVGFKGESCMDATKFLDKAFGVEKTTLKDSYYEDEETIRVDDGLPSGWCG
jgi:hypothetical protein